MAVHSTLNAAAEVVVVVVVVVGSSSCNSAAAKVVGGGGRGERGKGGAGGRRVRRRSRTWRHRSGASFGQFVLARYDFHYRPHHDCVMKARSGSKECDNV